MIPRDIPESTDMQSVVSGAHVTVLLVTTVVCGLMIRTSLVSGSVEDTNTAIMFAVGVLMFPPVCVIGSGWLLFLHIPTIIVCDHVNRSTQAITAARKRGTDHGINFDAIMQTLQRTHDSTKHLSILLAPALKTLLMMGATMCTHWLLMALTPRQHTGGTLPKPEIFFSGMIVMVIVCTWPMMSGASVTTACENLTAAIHALRARAFLYTKITIFAFCYTENHDLLTENDDFIGAPPELASDTSTTNPVKVQLAWPEDLIRIDGLRRYADEQNQCQGMGFTLFGKRVSANFVASVMLKGLAIILIFVPGLIYLMEGVHPTDLRFGSPGHEVNLVLAAGLFAKSGQCEYDSCVAAGSCARATANQCGEHCFGTNGVRRCGAVSSSSVGFGGEPNRAIDGNDDSNLSHGHCSETDITVGVPLGIPAEVPVWWEIDLGGDAVVTRVVIHRPSGISHTETILNYRDSASFDVRVADVSMYAGRLDYRRMHQSRSWWDRMYIGTTMCGSVDVDAVYPPVDTSHGSIAHIKFARLLTVDCEHGAAAGRFVSLSLPFDNNGADTRLAATLCGAFYSTFFGSILLQFCSISRLHCFRNLPVASFCSGAE